MKKIISLIIGCFLIYGSAIAMGEATIGNLDGIAATLDDSGAFVAALLLRGGASAVGRDLFQAVKDGDAELVEALLFSDADPNVTDAKGETPLHCACKIDMTSLMIIELADKTCLPVTEIRNFMDAGQVPELDIIGMISDAKNFFSRHHIELPDSPSRQAIVKALIEHGADVNKQSANKNTPLHYAAHYPMPKIMQLLIAAGADTNLMNANGKTPLNVVRRPEAVNLLNRNQSSRRFMIQQVAVHAMGIDFTNLTEVMRDMDQDWLRAIEIIRDGDVPAACALFYSEHFKDKINEPVGVVYHQSGHKLMGYTLLHYAARMGSPTMVTLLIAAGADVNALTNHGYSPLHAAASSGRADNASILAAAGAGVDLQDDDGMTALHCAALFFTPAVAQVLKDAHANENLRDTAGQTYMDILSEGMKEPSQSE